MIIMEFWTELKTAYGGEDIRKMFTVPQICWEDQGIYKMQTKEDFIFDDAFWDVFHKYPFHICHVNWGERELRFRVEEEDVLVLKSSDMNHKREEINGITLKKKKADIKEET